MTNFQKTLAAIAGGAVVLFAAAAYSRTRCPDQQLSKSGPFQGRTCVYGNCQMLALTATAADFRLPRVHGPSYGWGFYSRLNR